MRLHDPVRSALNIFSSFCFIILFVSRQGRCRRNVPIGKTSRTDYKYLSEFYQVYPHTELSSILVTTSASSRWNSSSDSSPKSYLLGYSGVPREELSKRPKDYSTPSTGSQSIKNTAEPLQNVFSGASFADIDVENLQSSASARLHNVDFKNTLASYDEERFNRRRTRGYNEHQQNKNAIGMPIRGGNARDSVISNNNNIDRDLEILRRQSITPVVYRFFARSQAAKAVATSITAGSSIPFILLVPNVDHWKLTGHELASRGYNVIAVGPKQDDPDDDEDNINNLENEEYQRSNLNKRYLQGPALILQLMDALRWTKVILVGCDSEAMMAIQAALSLSSSSFLDSKSPTSFFTGSDSRRSVVGLILCGKLDETESLITNPTYNFVVNQAEQAARRSEDYSFSSMFYSLSEKKISVSPSSQPFYMGAASSTSSLVIGRFLEQNVLCPFTIVWDGDEESLKSAGMPAATIINDQSYQYRTMIIGGGSAPHRKRPEYFAWVLSRFVEEKIAPSINMNVRDLKKERSIPQRKRALKTSMLFGDSTIDNSDQRRLPHISLPVPWKVPTEMLNEESFVVFGRVAATALFYGMMFKVLLYQYHNLRFGIDMITLFRQTALGTFRRAVLRTGSILFFTAAGTEPSVQQNDNILDSHTEKDDKNRPFNDLKSDFQQEKNITIDTPNTDVNDTRDQNRIQRFDKVKGLFSRFRNKTKVLQKNKEMELSLRKDRAMIGNQSESNSNSTQKSIHEESTSEANAEQDSNNFGVDDNTKLYEDDTLPPQNDSTERKRFNPIFLLDHVIT